MDPSEGMKMDAFEDTLAGLKQKNIKPKFIYTIPNHQNPTGAIMSLTRRKKLLQIARDHNIPILEDDCYGDVDFEPSPAPHSLLTLGGRDANFFVGSFSKILAPGFRLGYCYLPEKYLEQAFELKKFIDLGTSGFTSMVVAEFLRDNMWSHIERHCAIIKDKLDVLLDTLERNLSDQEVSWIRPKGGLFVWIKLPRASI